MADEQTRAAARAAWDQQHDMADLCGAYAAVEAGTPEAIPDADLDRVHRLARALADHLHAEAARRNTALSDGVDRLLGRPRADDPDDDGALEDAAAEDGWAPEGGWLDGGPEDVRG